MKLPCGYGLEIHGTYLSPGITYLHSSNSMQFDKNECKIIQKPCIA
jgi:hypothetical protein